MSRKASIWVCVIGLAVGVLGVAALAALDQSIVPGIFLIVVGSAGLLYYGTRSTDNATKQRGSS